jgi:hypothetical protein
VPCPDTAAGIYFSNEGKSYEREQIIIKKVQGKTGMDKRHLRA